MSTSWDGARLRRLTLARRRKVTQPDDRHGDRGRRALHWVLGGLVVLVVVGSAWGSAAHGAPPRPAGQEDPDEEISLEVRCLKPIEAVVPGGEGAGTGERAAHAAAGALLPPVGLVQRARQLNWMARYLGIGDWAPDFMRVTEDVPVRGPRWYVNEAKREAEDHHNCSLARHTVVGNCTQLRARIAPEPPRWGRGGQEVPPDWRPPPDPDVPNRDGLTGLLPDKCWGRYPSTAYDIHYDDGGFFSWDRKIWAGMTGMIHTIGKAAIQIGLGLIGFAFGTFHVLDYRRIALTAADRYQDHLVGPFGLADIAYVALFGMVAMKALSGKLGVAGGEIVMSLVLATLASVLMANQEGYLEGAAETMDDLTSSVLAAGAGHNPSDNYNPQGAIRPVQETLFNEFVDAPFDYIHFGGRITEKACLDRRDRILRANVPSDGGWAIRYMGGEEECERYSRSMGEPTGQKMLTALLVTAVCIGVAVVVGGAAITMLVSKILLLVLFALAPFAAVGAILPGLGRRLAWSWVATLLQAFLAAGGMALVLSMFLIGIQGVTEQTRGLGAFERWVVLLVIVAVIFLMRARIVAGSQKLSGSFGDRMTRLSPAAAHWQGSGTTGGVDLAAAGRRIGRGASATVGYGMAQAPLVGLAAVGGAVGIGATSYGRMRTAQLGLRNLRNMELDKRMADNMAIPQWHRYRKAGRLARAFAAKGGGRKGGGGGPGGGGGGFFALPFGRGGGPGGTPFVFNPRGPRLNLNTPGPTLGGRMKTAMGNWMRPRMDGLAQKAHFDQAKHAMGRGWDRAGTGAKEGWVSVRDTMKARWTRREASLPNVYRPDFVANYGAQRQAIYQRYATRRSEARAQARAAGRRVEPQQMRDLHATYRDELRDHRAVWRSESRARNEQARLRSQPPPPPRSPAHPTGAPGPPRGAQSLPGDRWVAGNRPVPAPGDRWVAGRRSDGGAGGRGGSGGSPPPPSVPLPPADAHVAGRSFGRQRDAGGGTARYPGEAEWRRQAERWGWSEQAITQNAARLRAQYERHGVTPQAFGDELVARRAPGAGRQPDGTPFGFNRPSTASPRTPATGRQGSRGKRTGAVEPKAQAGFGNGPPRPKSRPADAPESRAVAGFGDGGPPRMRRGPRDAPEAKAHPGFGKGPPRPRTPGSEPRIVGGVNDPIADGPRLGPTPPSRREVHGRPPSRRVPQPRNEGPPSVPPTPKPSKPAKPKGGSQPGSPGQPYWPPGSTQPKPPYPPPAAPSPKPPRPKPPKGTGKSASERTATPFLDPGSVPAPAYPPPAGKPPRRGSTASRTAGPPAAGAASTAPAPGPAGQRAGNRSGTPRADSRPGRHRRPGPSDQGVSARAGGQPMPAPPGPPRPPKRGGPLDDVDPSALQRRWFDRNGHPRAEDRNRSVNERLVMPSRRPDPSHQPKIGSQEKYQAAMEGRRAALETQRAKAEATGSDAALRRVRLEQESEDTTAAVAARLGFEVEQFPAVPKHHRQVQGPAERLVRHRSGHREKVVDQPGKDPDLRIGGKFFDNKLIWSESAVAALRPARKSLKKGQAEGVVLDLSLNRSVTFGDLLRELRKDPPAGEVWARRGNVLVPLWPPQRRPRSGG